MAPDPAERAIRRVLVDLQAFGLNAGRVMRLTRPEDSLRFVQARIASTMLARRLLFDWNGIPRLACDVTGCRLLGFAVLDAGGATTGTMAVPDPSEAEATLAALARTILDCGRGASRISVRWVPLPSSTEPAVAGVPASALEVAFDLVRTPACLQAFLEAAGGAVFAAAEVRADSLHALVGDEAALEALADSADRDLSHFEAVLADGAGGPALLMVSGPDCTLALAAIRDKLVLAEVAPGAEAAIALAWQAEIAR